MPQTAAHKPPAPQTKRAVLRSAGFTRQTFTVHHYKETRLVMIAGPGGGPAYEHVFECFRTGVQRRWGLERGPEDDELDPVETAEPSPETN